MNETPSNPVAADAQTVDPLRVAALVAHQLKGPLGSAGSTLRMVLEEYAGHLSPRQKELLGKADRRIDEAVETVRRMLTLVAPGDHRAARANASELARRTAERYLDEAEARHIALGLDLRTDPAWARIGEPALTEILRALLENALKYTPRHGEVRLRLSAAPDGAFIDLAVDDSGIGVPEDQRKRVFEPFYRSGAARASAHAGIGLGLAFVKALAEAAQGHVSAEASDLGGASFVVRLPAAPDEAERQPAVRRPRVVIIGGVAAGPKVASKVIRLRPETEVTVIERGDVLSYAGCGLPYYISGVVKEQRDLMATPLGSVRDPVFFQNVKNVKVLNRTEAVEIDRRAKRVRVRAGRNGEESWIPYDTLVLATGARPVIPPLPGVDRRHVFSLHGVHDAEGIRRLLAEGVARDVVIVGGGLIGVEMTEALVARGCRVTIVELRDQILGMLDPELAMLLVRHMEGHGVRVLTRTAVEAFEGDEAVREVVTNRGRIPADLVILGAGIRPDVALARQAGLDLGPTGALAVDDRMRTSDADIYAAGDCVECRDLITGKPCYVPLGSTANKQGRTAAVNLCGGDERFPGVLGSTICKVFDYAVARTGLSEREARAAGYDVVRALAPSPDAEHFMPGAQLLMLKLVADRRTRKLLGVQAIGPGRADKRTDVAATAITGGMTVDDLAQLDLGYAPSFSPAMDNLITAANILRNKLAGLVRGLSPAEVQARIEAREDFILLDVSTAREYEALHIPGSTHIPFGALRGRMETLPRDKDIVTLCRLSIRGYEAALMLQAAGFERVAMLDGGSIMWPYDILHEAP